MSNPAQRPANPASPNPASLNKAFVQRALTTVDAGTGSDVVTAGLLEWVAACDGYAAVKLNVPSGADAPAMMQLASECDAAIRRAAARDGLRVDGLRFSFVNHAGDVVLATGTGPDNPAAHAAPARAAAPAPAPASASTSASTAAASPPPATTAPSLPGVRHVIAVGAGKGGVGKSTIAVNLAVGLARRGHAVGLLDGDIYGPSLPTMLGLDAMEQAVIGGKLQPFLVHGVKAVTIGKLVDPEKPLIWRGPMAHGAFRQLVDRTEWGELDYLVIDLPPGTGDVALTMAQSLQLTGAVVVCTPQRVAQDDAVRAARMFQQLGIEVLGVVENMSFFIGDDGKEYDLFGRGGAQIMAQRLGLPYLGAVPINTRLRINSDEGEPRKNYDQATAGGPALPRALEDLLANVESQIALASLRQGTSRPTLTIS